MIGAKSKIKGRAGISNFQGKGGFAYLARAEQRNRRVAVDRIEQSL
jgi:hypothetical protein